MKKILLTPLFLGVVISGVFFWKSISPKPVIQTENNPSCNHDSVLCSDGTYVGRTGPQCEFSLCEGSTDMVSKYPSLKSKKYRAEEVVGNLTVPWQLVFTSPERILVTERAGDIRVIESGILQEAPLFSHTKVHTSFGEGGLMGMVLSPEYKKNKYVYVCYAYVVNFPQAFVAVDRLIDNGNTIAYDKTILDGIPSGSLNTGCRIGFGPDKKLYVTTGHAFSGGAQSVNNLAGKTLRINEDGTTPNDNPFGEYATYTWGHKNSQGLAWDAKGNMYESEHGPDNPNGGEEINLIEKGKNYGFPEVTHLKMAPEYEPALLVMDPSIGPSELLIYSGDVFPELKDNLIIAALRGSGLYRVLIDKDNPRRVRSQEKILGLDVGRVRTVVQSPSGEIYFATSNRDGRGEREDDDKVYKLIAE